MSIVRTGIVLFLFVCLAGCQKEDDFQLLPVKIEYKGGIIEGNNQPGYYLYPNPFKSFLTVSVSGGNSRICITNNKGQTINIDSGLSGDYLLDFSNCEDQVFWCEILIDGTVYHELLLRKTSFYNK